MTEPLQPLSDDDITTARKLCETSDSYRELGAAFIEYVPRLLSEVERLLSEVERLRAEQLRADSDAMMMPAALAEIERLRAENVRLRYDDEVRRSQLRARELTADERAVLRGMRAAIAARFGDDTADVAVLDKLLKETP